VERQRQRREPEITTITTTTTEGEKEAETISWEEPTISLGPIVSVKSLVPK